MLCQLETFIKIEQRMKADNLDSHGRCTECSLKPRQTKTCLNLEAITHLFAKFFKHPINPLNKPILSSIGFDVVMASNDCHCGCLIEHLVKKLNWFVLIIR